MAKKIRISDDGGSTYFTLPGGTGSKEQSAAAANDTIFGQTFESTQTALIELSVSANALYKGFAGYVATIKKQGTSTTFTDEAFTVVSGQRYDIDDATKNMWDRAGTFVVKDGVTDVTVEVESYNYLFGEILFKSTYTVIGAITVSGKYFPLATLGKGNSFTLTQQAATINDTDFATAQANGGYATMSPGLRTVSLDLDGIFAAASGLIADLQGRTELMIEVNPDGNSKSRCRGFFKALSHSQSGDVGDLENETVSFSLSVPASPSEFPFAWKHESDTTLSSAIQKLLTAWSNEAKVDIEYLHDGTNGVTFKAVITDLSLSSSLTDMNEFSADFSADGAPTTVP